MTSWQVRTIETYVEKELRKKYRVDGDSKFGIYTIARQRILGDIAQHIVATEPFLSDHGPDHIANVLDNCWLLLGDDIKKISPLEIYCLILSVLFHDIGNIFDRKDHQRTAAKVFEYIWPDAEHYTEEIRIINRIIVAHCGKASNGTNDTLQEVESTEQMLGQKIRLKLIASIVRFADELAEGMQRTSLFISKYFGHHEDSKIFHEYAKITKIMIDRGNKRIAVNYDICLNKSAKLFDDKKKKSVKDLLDFTFKRIIKLNQERQYAKYYSSGFLPFEETSINFNFQIGPFPHALDVPKIVLNELVIPGENFKKFSDYNSELSSESIVERLDQKIQKGLDHD